MSGQRRRVQSRPDAHPDSLEPGSPPAYAAPSNESFSGERLLALRDYGETVAQIGAALALPPDRLARAEALDRLELDTDLPLSVVESWEAPAVRGWFSRLGADLRMDLTLSAGDTTVSLRAGRDPSQALADLLASARQAAQDTGEEVTISVRLAVAKSRAHEGLVALLALRPEYLGTPEMLARTKVAVFYSAAAFERLIGLHALGDWERLGLASEHGRAVVLLCDRAGYLAGVALEVLGVRDETEPRWLTISRAGFRQFRQRAEQMRALYDEEGSWVSAPRVLTPFHLRVESRASGLEDTAARLAELQAGLAAAYLADTVQTSTHNELILRFAGARPAICRIPAKTATGRGEQPYYELARLSAWAYDNATPDKLAIARECLAHELPHGGDLPLAGIERVAPAALEAAKANFTLYLRRNSEQYFAVRQKVLDAVSEYASAVRKAVSDLTGEVTDNVYRTVGLLVGVVIAGLIQPSLSLGVARLAAFLYVAYIAFLLAFFMRARWHRFELEKASLESRFAAMPELGASERDTLSRQPAEAEAYFTRYFRRAWWIYLGLGAAGLLLFLILLTPLASLTGLPHAPAPAPTPSIGR